MKIEFINRYLAGNIKACKKCGEIIKEKSPYYIIGDNYDDCGDFCPDCAAVILANWAEKKSNGEVYFFSV